MSALDLIFSAACILSGAFVLAIAVGAILGAVGAARYEREMDRERKIVTEEQRENYLKSVDFLAGKGIYRA